MKKKSRAPAQRLTAEELRKIYHSESMTREHERESKELHDMGLKLGEPIIVFGGVKLVCDGYEGPYVTLITKEGTEKRMNKAECQLWMNAFMTAVRWCKHGDAPGMC